MFFNRPLVHVGFLKSWVAGDFDHKVVSRTMDIVNSCKADANKLKIHITGELCSPLLEWQSSQPICAVDFIVGVLLLSLLPAADNF